MKELLQQFEIIGQRLLRGTSFPIGYRRNCAGGAAQAVLRNLGVGEGQLRIAVGGAESRSVA